MTDPKPHIGDLVAEMLAKSGVEYVFGMPGGQTTALHDGISRRQDRIKHILMRDERNAAYAADGYARITGKPGVCDVTVGPGSNLLPAGFFEALNASIPMLGIIGELPLDWLPLKEKGIASQGYDQLSFFKTCSKEAFLVPSIAALPELIRTSLRIATAPRPGPVALIIPHDIFDADWDMETLLTSVDDRTVRTPYLRSVAPPSEIDKAIALIKKAKRPAMVCGGGVHGADACDEVTAFADRLGALVVTSLSGKGSVPETRDYVAGVLNPLGSKAAIDLVPEADLVIWCGSKVSQNTGMNWSLPTPEQATITIDFDPLEHGRTFRPTVPLLGDVRSMVQALDAALGESRADANPEWMARIAEVKAECDKVKAAEMASDQIPVLPPRVMAELDKRLGDKDIVVSDASFSAGWISGYLPARQTGRKFVFARGQGGLGYSVPGAIGVASVIEEGGHVVTLAGDGAFSYTIGELATQAQYDMPIINIVINNGTLGWIQLWQEIFFKNPQSCALEKQGYVPGYAAAAAGLGLKGIYVEKPDDIGKALDEAFAHDGPSVVEVRIDDRATPIHSFKRRMREPEDKPRPRPGTVYKLREWKVSPDL
ncbi:MAG: thiamine pyrophosphate-binding protein [Alphaproteobacteria bacterium]|jgi:acetolactate synthase-1/2/3 large subunit|nr:thiamine pyrophosphate-binding protein [Alphaproteobacteria bacterium]MBU1827705.1 thiamine pyrophosphate-binding protein [Alphaproteobacteria bacterium]MBU2077615.1 thiamine pyrophosphate-binding protein [Alphaproteobacteria bacterium]MBU2161093.1 thiamine pyrophosphate-binding protein [Alphaproteobacteria bacterium]MBU2242522.1 thiamine pyrophosphate-binding protein [Alphaproteobacteria bacterium]